MKPYKIKSRKTVPPKPEKPVKGPHRRNWDELFVKAEKNPGVWFYFDTPFGSPGSAYTTARDWRRCTTPGRFEIEARQSQVYVRAAA